MDEASRAALAVRVFVLATLLPLAALSGVDALRLALVVAAIALAATVGGLGRQLWALALAEAAAISALVVVALPQSSSIAPYLVVPALVAALDGGRRRLVLVVATEAVVLLLAWLALGGGWERELAMSALLWLAAATGVGWMGVRLERALSSPEDDQPYRSAVALIRRLEALSGRLSGGLDAVGAAEEIMDLAEDLVPLRSAGVFVRSAGGTMVPVRYTAGTAAGTMGWAAELSERCWEYEAMMLRERRLGLPLTVNGEIVAVLVVEAVRPIEGGVVARLRSDLGRATVQLQAALLFGRVRDTAMTQERQRIAREVHDGVAQDVAGLGYLIDNLVSQTHDPGQRDRLVALRHEVSKVVTELRYSVFDLRQEQAATSGLGESITAYANQIGATSQLTVHVTLDEEGPRLPRDQEFELMRVAQEAMTNARKHAQARNLWVRCTVRAPYAEVEVIDDGEQEHRPRPDSQGMKIMRERAHAIGAELVVTPPEPARPGTRVWLRVGSTAS